MAVSDELQERGKWNFELE